MQSNGRDLQHDPLGAKEMAETDNRPRKRARTAALEGSRRTQGSHQESDLPNRSIMVANGATNEVNGTLANGESDTRIGPTHTINRLEYVRLLEQVRLCSFVVGGACKFHE